MQERYAKQEVAQNLRRVFRWSYCLNYNPETSRQMAPSPRVVAIPVKPCNLAQPCLCELSARFVDVLASDQHAP